MIIIDRLIRRRMIASVSACLASAVLVSAAHAQSIMRTPNLRIETRMPTVTPRIAPRIAPRIGIAPKITPRINPNALRAVAPRTVTGARTITNFKGATFNSRINARPAGVAGRAAGFRGTAAGGNRTGTGAANIAGRGTGAGSNTPAGTNSATAGGAGRGAGRAGRGGGGVTTTPASTPTHVLPVTTNVPPRVAVVLPTIPYVRYSPNTYPSCTYASRDSSGECKDRPAFVADLGGGSGGVGSGGPPPVSQNGAPRRTAAQAAFNQRYVANQVVAELDASLSDAQVAALARRHRLALVSSQDVPLIGSRMNLFRITDGRPVDTVRRQLAGDRSVRSVQPNFRYVLQDQTSTPALSEGDPAQYAVAKLRLPQAHALSHGSNVTVAVIDSGIDANHPELVDTVVGSFDALGSKEGPHVHGTGIAGAIVSHARLVGSAPAARILAIRAFGVTRSGAESTSFVILKSLDYAAGHGAQIINMSFAGPKDSLVDRGIAAAEAKGIVLVAASGNAGPKSPPLYPAASPGVIAVSATDAYDRLFPASNRGSHIAVAAPGVDVFLPAPGGKYQMTSGTSFSAAYVSGLAALMVSRNPAIKPDDVRGILMRTARDLGAPGRDDLFGAGEADAFGAVSAVAAALAPVAAATDGKATTPALSSSQNREAAGAAPDPQPELASGKPPAQ